LDKIIINAKESSYPVYTGKGIFKKLPDLISERGLYKNLFIVIDARVEKLHGKLIRDVFKNYGRKIVYYILKSGEGSKSLKEISSLYSSLVENHFGRDTLMIAIGGGVTGDLSGFAASTYMRGIQLVHIPTTIISAVDSSVGGKTAINLNRVKNIIGTIHHPEFVLIDTGFLNTLPEADLYSGTGEIIKYAFLTDYGFYNYISNNLEKIYLLDPGVLRKVIPVCLSFKGSVVEADEKEEGLRKILNLGHTFAHAFESASDFKYKHGAMVIAGIVSSLFLSNKTGILSDKKLKELLKLPLKARILSRIELNNHRAILNFMYSDKKNREGKISFVLLSDIGKVITDVNVSERDILYSLRQMNKILSSGSV
jgi:3-dehydroquinate synthase